ncbi:MAG: tRNA (cytidine(34)-2'-O)-methyltransferase [Alphaproteobacteria bacterium]
MRLALFEPDIPQNTGALLRLAACLGVAVDIIEPCGFLMDDKRLKRAGLDYLALARVTRHRSWADFVHRRQLGKDAGRLVLATTRGSVSFTDFAFAPTDTLMVGRESSGVPDAVAGSADATVRIPLIEGARSINVAQAAAMVLGEALRQTNLFPPLP